MTTARGGPAGSGAREPGAAADRDVLFRMICESMAYGVMLIDGKGRTETFNPAAAEILGLEREAVVGHSFAEVFVANGGFEELSEAVLAAIYEGAVGRQQVVNVTVDGRIRPLAVESSYLRGTESGEGSDRALVAVFSDISELERLRAKELALARDLQSKHEELREAYRSLEGRNVELGTLLQKIRAVRLVASACAVVLVLGIGAYLWNESPTAWFGAKETHAGGAVAGVRLLVVEPKRIVSTITVASEIGPRRQVSVTSPIGGQVGAVHVKLGESVAAGQPLLSLDVSEVEIQRRKAQAIFLKAKAEAERLANWKNSVDASKAKRAVTKARIALEGANTKFEETAFLVEQGLTPAAREKAAERERRARRLDLESAEQDFDAVLDKGPDKRELARLELANAKEDLERIERLLRNATVTAPVAGVVLRLGEGFGRDNDGLSPGTSIEPGQHLVTIADMEGVTTAGRVDEVDVRRIRPGHAVRIAGPAFPGITLEGTVTHVSSRAFRSPGGKSLPTFEIAAVVDKLDPQQREAVRLGMSADMQIVIHESERALVVPVKAVDLSNGTPRVRVRDETTGSERVVEVKTGVTTLDSVEILAGLAPGDKVIVP
ncbi:MAG: efflux RND transporter periplasmic adaptor subunit [Deltaproteobacteria bacterium]|nr:efflux RND transporter periplasmic adaptor subunit [Deltaproteobacteria bacterium]